MSRLAVAVVSGGLSLALLGTVVPAHAVPSGPDAGDQPATTRTVTASAPDARRAAPAQLRRQGRWLVDPEGRVVIVHGLNLVYKHQPYVPPASAFGFRERDADWFRRPDWAMNRPLPFSLTPYLPVPFPLGYWTPEVSTVFDRFWAGEDGVLDGWVAAWEAAAWAWRDQPYSMGYDLMNEPWAGLEWTECLLTGCQRTYTHELQPRVQQGAAGDPADRPGQSGLVGAPAVRGWPATGHLLHRRAGGGEPRLLVAQILPRRVPRVPGDPGQQRGELLGVRPRTPGAPLEHGEEMQAATMMSEWGATDNVRAIEIDAAVADEYLMGWTHWAYKLWNDPTTADGNQGLFADDADPTTVKQDKLLTLVRTYAQRTAGIPEKMHFDTATGAFEYRYRPDPGITAPTEIFVSPLHYPQGWEVTVENGRVVKEGARRVQVRADGAGVVTVRVVRR